MAANNSIAVRTMFPVVFPAISDIYTAANNPIGTPRKSAVVVPTTEAKIINPIP